MADFSEIQVTLGDGYDAYARYWAPDTLRGAVLCHHGIQSHCDWYAGSARRLCEAGYGVLQIDRRGSGRNQAARGHAESAAQLIDDAKIARDTLRQRTGREAYHVVGVSWGGKLGVAAYIDHPEKCQSLSLVTPGLFPLVGVSKDEAHQIGVAMIYEPDASFDIPLNSPDLFTRSQRWRDFHASDPLTLRQCTAGFYLASRRMDKPIGKLSAVPPVPIHLLTAGEERIVDNEKTIRFIKELGWDGTVITNYPSAKHSIEFDQPEKFYADLIAFIDRCQSNA